MVTLKRKKFDLNASYCWIIASDQLLLSDMRWKWYIRPHLNSNSLLPYIHASNYHVTKSEDHYEKWHYEFVKLDQAVGSQCYR